MTGREAKQRFRGCYVATLTPFDSRDQVDSGAIQAHVDWLIEAGVAGLCPAGTTGEFLFLMEEEKAQIIAATVSASKGRVPVLAGVWALRAEQVAHLAKHAEEVGADGLFLPTPIYYPANEQAVFDWYAGVHSASSLPLFAYNIPQYAANEVSLSCLERLLREGIIVGAKDSSGKAERIAEQVRLFGEEGTVFAASDSFATQGRKLGADGFISAIANAVPSLFVRLWGGEESLQGEVDALRTKLKSVGAISALKQMLTQQGIPFGRSRIPYSDLPAGWH
jgi:4-hydroxy-tetrahydrodipicolinate synthase